jgi:hypothetical protein
MSEESIHANGGERLTKVETQVDNITVELGGIWKVLRDIQDSLSKSQRTDWQTIFIGLSIVGVLYASAIHPINADIERTSKTAEQLAAAVLVQDKNAEDEKIERIRAEDDLDKRTAILEFQMRAGRPAPMP